MRENGRWRLTDLQTFCVVLTVVASLFLFAMALGGSSVLLMLVSAALLVVVGLAVLLLGLRQNGGRGAQGTGYVIAVQRPPVDNIKGRCEMRMRVNLPGRPAVDMKVRDPAVPVAQWPLVGQTLPIEVAPNSSRQIRVRWDLVEMGYVRVPDTTPPRNSAPASPSPARSEPAVPLPVSPALAPGLSPDYSPTPPSTPVEDYSPTPGSGPAGGAPAADQGATPSTSPPSPSPKMETERETETVRVYFDYAEGAFDDDFSPRAPRPPDPVSPDRPAPPTSFVADPYAELDEFGEPVAFGERSRLGDDLNAPTIGPASDVEPRGIPSPRAEEPTIRFSGSPRKEGDIPAMGGMLIVADLDRSLRFYSEVLGFTIVYAASGNAVVEYGSGRILLQHMADFSPIDRRVGHLHIEVPDLDVAFTDLVIKGVEFSHRPRMVSRGEDMELWKATFRDPDGHGIALTEWRRREFP